jgi:hypothetical protein
MHTIEVVLTESDGTVQRTVLREIDDDDLDLAQVIYQAIIDENDE